MNRILKLFIFICAGVIFISQSYAQNFLVTPYLQPGNASALSKEQKSILWQTDSIPGNYSIECTEGIEFKAGAKIMKGKIAVSTLRINKQTTHLYKASLTGLKTDNNYAYRLMLNGKEVYQGKFSSRSKLNKTRFAVFGDCGVGSEPQAEIAYRISKLNPQFVLITGDNVYSYGLQSEYRTRFFPIYNGNESSEKAGAPLMKSIPFYLVVGNHDVYGSDFDKRPDGLAYFYYNDLPLNGPKTKTELTAKGNPELVKNFLAATGERFPKMANFSYDYGNVHFTVLDANPHTSPLDPALVEWLVNDIKSSKAEWKIVSYHHPGFNSSKAHYDYQYMRLLSPILEQLKVDLVLTGHVHNYQRSVPLKFDPKKDSTGTSYKVSPEGRVDGKFTLDTNFDGITKTKPDGIIYIVTGAGGAALYDPALSGKPDLWKHDPQENWVPFTAKIVSDIHSFTMIETDGKKLNLKQLNPKGEVIDEITITK